MSVLQTDIKFHGSGSNNLGGAINLAAEIPSQPHALFDPIRAAEALNGATDYRCIYIRNAHATDTLTDPVVWIQAQPSNPGVSVEIAIGGDTFNGVETALPGGNENTAPGNTAITFVKPTAATNGLKFMQADQAGPTGDGELGAGDYKAIWIKRVVAPAAAAMPLDQFTLGVLGETT